MTTPAKEPSLRAQLLAEFLGVMMLIMLGNGVVAMVVLFGHDKPGEVIKGGYTNITLGWGLAVALAVYLTRGVSGAHLNPAVTVALAVYRGFCWRRVPWFCLVQILGAFAGAALVYINYYPKLVEFWSLHDEDMSKAAGIFTTFPAAAQEFWYFSLFDQVIGTAILVAMIFALTDKDNDPVPSGFTPLVIGLVVVAIGMSWGGMHGYAINPARDVGPRLFYALATNGQAAGFHGSIWWVPLVGPLLGGLLGALVYDRLIKPNLPHKKSESLSD
jgi:glycerol uptake facilitator protein